MNYRRSSITGSLFSLLLLASPAIYAASGAPARDSLAHKLAEIDEGRVMEPSSIEAYRARAALSGAERTCTADVEMLADQVVRLSQILKKDGIYSRPVDMLEGLKAIYEGSPKKIDCSNGLIQYATVRKNAGFTHSEAVAALRVLFNKLGS